MPFLPSKKWIKTRAAWRGAVLAQIREWAEDRGDLYDKATHNVAVRRLERLEMLERVLRPKEHFKLGWPYDPADAAAMIVLPRRKARKLAHSFFGEQVYENGKPVDVDYDVADAWLKKFNLDWFDPGEY